MDRAGLEGRPGARRRTQARSIATRARLVDAAVEVLMECGYDGLTTTEVCTRTGSSRGALLHHFPTRVALVAATVERTLELRLEAFGLALDKGTWGDAEAGIDLDSLLAALWEAFSDAAFVAWAELWMAARTDAALAAQMLEIDRRFTDESRAMFTSLVVDDADGSSDATLVRDLVFAVLVGLGFQHLLDRPRRDVGDYFGLVCRLVRAELQMGEPSS